MEAQADRKNPWTTLCPFAEMSSFDIPLLLLKLKSMFSILFLLILKLESSTTGHIVSLVPGCETTNGGGRSKLVSVYWNIPK